MLLVMSPAKAQSNSISTLKKSHTDPHHKIIVIQPGSGCCQLPKCLKAALLLSAAGPEYKPTKMHLNHSSPVLLMQKKPFGSVILSRTDRLNVQTDCFSQHFYVFWGKNMDVVHGSTASWDKTRMSHLHMYLLIIKRVPNRIMIKFASDIKYERERKQRLLNMACSILRQILLMLDSQRKREWQPAETELNSRHEIWLFGMK